MKKRTIGKVRIERLKAASPTVYWSSEQGGHGYRPYHTHYPQISPWLLESQDICASVTRTRAWWSQAQAGSALGGKQVRFTGLETCRAWKTTSQFAEKVPGQHTQRWGLLVAACLTAGSLSTPGSQPSWEGRGEKELYFRGWIFMLEWRKSTWGENYICCPHLGVFIEQQSGQCTESETRGPK